MNENENLVTENVAENAETPAEQTPAAKTFTQEEVDQIVGKRVARRERTLRREYDRKYGALEKVLKAGTGKETVDEMTDTFSQFYESKGVEIPREPEYSPEDINTLAKAEAEEFIKGGYDDVVEEVDRLTGIGADKMTPREKALFEVLANHRNTAERNRELEAVGITEEVYNSKEYQDFARQFTKDVPVSKVYELYQKTQPQKEIKPMGSMKNTNSADNGVKEYYSPEEARKFTKADYDKNPALYDAVVKSMSKWR